MGKKQPIISNNSRKESTCSRSSATSSSSRRSIFLKEGIANMQIMVAEPNNFYSNYRFTDLVEDILKKVSKKICILTVLTTYYKFIYNTSIIILLFFYNKCFEYK